MCTFRACELESTFLEIHDIVLPLTKYLLKVLGHSTTGELQNSPCMLGLPICTLKSNVPESTLLVIQNFALPSVELLLNTKGDLQNSLCRLDFLTCTLKTYGLESTLLKIQNLASPFGEHLLKVLGHSTN